MTLNIATVRREALWLIIGLIVGVALLPPLIALVGGRFFGAYGAGTTHDLVNHFFHGLGAGEQAVWVIALGPYLVLLTVRLTLGAIQAVRREA